MQCSVSERVYAKPIHGEHTRYSFISILQQHAVEHASETASEFGVWHVHIVGASAQCGCSGSALMHTCSHAHAVHMHECIFTNVLCMFMGLAHESLLIQALHTCSVRSAHAHFACTGSACRALSRLAWKQPRLVLKTWPNVTQPLLLISRKSFDQKAYLWVIRSCL